MTNLNKKGPENEGPMTGRKQGYCNGTLKKDEVPEDQEYGLGRGGKPCGCGYGQGRGNGGRGRRCRRELTETIEEE